MRTLLVSGSLAPEAVREQLRSAAAPQITVLEMDTRHNRNLYRDVSAWKTLPELLPIAEGLALNAQAETLVDVFLAHDIPAEGIPTHRAFRAACLGPHAWRLVVPYLLNLHVATRAIDLLRPTRVLVAAGGGIHFKAWQEAALAAGLSLQLLQPETISTRLTRRLWKAWHRWRKPPMARLPESSFNKLTGSQILCTSERVSRLLARSADELASSIQALPSVELKVKDPAQLEEMRLRYARWWENFRASLGDSLTGPIQEMATHYVSQVYPTYACLYLQAKAALESKRPLYLLCDTQTGTPERMWSLAAQELGIPVIAYNYDQMVRPKFSFTPDVLLADSGRSAMTAVQNGMPADRILQIRSHRQRKAETPESSLKTTNSRPVVLFADGYYAGTRADLDPASSYDFYQLIHATARLVPEADFTIKFHPLRERKKASLSFLAMDETELRLRQEYIEALSPPSNLRLLAPEISLAAMLPEVDILLNYNSTSGLEAFEADVPVIFLQHLEENVRAYPRIHDFQACRHGSTPTSLAAEIRQLLNDPAVRKEQIRRQRRYLDEYYWPAGPELEDGIRQAIKQLSAPVFES